MPDATYAILQQAGFKGAALKTAWAIAKRESGFNPAAFNGNAGTGDRSWGLFQINTLGKLASRVKTYGLKSERDLLDPATNARVAYAMSKGGTDFGAWGIGPNAYRKMPALDFNGYPAGQTATAPATRAFAGAKAAATTRVAQTAITMKDLNGLARQFGFKDIGHAFGIDAKHAKELTRSAVLVQSPRATNPTGMAFQAKPLPKGQSAGKGVAELFYDPAGKGQQWSPGWSNPIGGHSDHVHVSFSSPQTALRLIQLAEDMGLHVGENPYVDHVDPVHVTGSFHYKTFAGTFNGKKLGEAIDVSGTATQMMAYYKASRRFIG